MTTTTIGYLKSNKKKTIKTINIRVRILYIGIITKNLITKSK